ncbi:hypothetical protein RHGRI_003355 [Rhododendron griersonianum]|uniref:Uncharacterized protein n=1 Tax=Rhododendron griersonianum TaxID=479676 RepID=A0AAV6L5R9_9ERIC|nr:hypothetical protein RHGRI_038735 [Rhododendron griersonianum]KAG5560041.1 hypothetical protein RHGRI_003355 [Rhododendron griersonianum]
MELGFFFSFAVLKEEEIWTARNEVIFSNKHPDVAEVVDLIKTRVAFWIKAKFNVMEYSVEDFKRGIEVIRRKRI